MPDEQRTVCYDHDLHIEAYRLQGIVQKFPNHFHDYYVVGFVESGARRLWCKGKTYDLTAGDLILFSPRDNHYCTPVNGEPLDYRAVNIPADVMQRAAKEVTGQEDMPYFSRSVVRQGDCVHALRALYAAIQDGAPALEKQEMFSICPSSFCPIMLCRLRRRICPNKAGRSAHSVPIWSSITRITSRWMSWSAGRISENPTCCGCSQNRWACHPIGICRTSGWGRPKSCWRLVCRRSMRRG